MDLNIWGNISDLTSVDGDLVCKHTGGRHLDRIRPVVVVEAEGVSEVKDSILGDLGRVVSNIEMCWFHSSLSDVVRDEEEVKLSIDDFWLLYESLVDISTLGWVLIVSGLRIEESLSDSLVNDDQSYSRGLSIGVALSETVFVGNDDLELLKFIVDDLLSHWVTDSISVDENVVRHTFVVFLVCLESWVEVFLKNAWLNDLLAFLTLRTSLSVVLAHMWIIGGTKSDDTLLALVTNIDANKHSFLRDLGSEVHPP